MESAGWSERSFDTFYSAVRDLRAVGGDTLGESLQMATRPNGSINVSKLRRIADIALMVNVRGGAL
jgi:hypothetical protein